MLTAGFPCQDISNAGKREGIKEGNRSGLWFEIVRIIRSRSPRWVFLENVAALTIRGLDIVLKDLSESGYDAQWDIVSAESVGAPHIRKRIWIIAYSSNKGYSIFGRRSGISDITRKTNAKSANAQSKQTDRELKRGIRDDDGTSSETPHNRGKRIQGIITQPIQRVKEFSWCKDIRRVEDYFDRPDVPQPLICREDDGFSSKMDRLKCLGNAVVPQVVTHVGRCIDEAIDEGTI